MSARRQIGIKLRVDLLERIDSERGSQNRTAWIEDACEARLEDRGLAESIDRAAEATLAEKPAKSNSATTGLLTQAEARKAKLAQLQRRIDKVKP